MLPHAEPHIIHVFEKRNKKKKHHKKKKKKKKKNNEKRRTLPHVIGPFAPSEARNSFLRGERRRGGARKKKKDHPGGPSLASRAAIAARIGTRRPAKRLARPHRRVSFELHVACVLQTEDHSSGEYSY